ncbi:MAG: PAS-domain containing protein [Alphaproteobacteria bacterium]|nr:PAS-domain containing protein [Alphaproteobacteria bacterium]
MRISYYIIGALLLVALAVGSAHQYVSWERAQAVAEAEQRATRLATFFQGHVESTLRYADDYIKLIRNAYLGTRSLETVRELVRKVPPDNKILSHITVMNANGVPELITNGLRERNIKPGTHARDRDYFKFQKDNNGDRAFVSLAAKGRNTGLVTVRLVRRLVDSQGDFGGVIFAAVKAEQLLAFFQTTRMGPNSSATLVGLDKVIRLRYTNRLNGVGQRIERSQLWRMLEDSPLGVYRQTSIVDGMQRILAYRMLDRVPLVAVIGVAKSDAFAAVSTTEAYTYAIAGLISVIVLALLALSLREKVAADRLGILRATFENINQGIAVFDARHRLAAFNEKFAEITELPPDCLYVGMPRDELRRHGERQHGYQLEDTADAGGDLRARHHERTLPSGRTYIFERTLLPDGGFISTVTDVTVDYEAKKRLEEAQKMEAVGQLTGGVAHDFNNLLAVIMGNAELLNEAPKNAPSLIDNILSAATRAANLTQQLLAFSRRQPLRPQPLNMAELVNGLADTLEHPIVVATEIDPGLWRAYADQGQLRNAIRNLMHNARDAMPEGGTLTLRCRNVHLPEGELGSDFEAAAGDYVMVELSDTGTGMAPEALEHAFEPFFTTKEVGEGSGLGLSMVYGFAKQSGGHVTIESLPGDGTTVRLYLPRADIPSAKEEDSGRHAVPSGEGQAVLVVEDDPDVRDLVESMVASLGYDVHTAPTAAHGEQILGRVKVDAVLSDIILPGGVSGPGFVRKIRERRPDLPVVFMSGYSADDNIVEGALSEKDILIKKPFRKDDIAAALSAVMDTAPPR